jgi:hypothetical protein
VIHDLSIPRSSANIDHIAFNPDGIWVIDSKKYRGGVEVSGLFNQEIRVGGRRRANLVLGVEKQVRMVAEARDRAFDGRNRPLVHGALCFVEASWALFSNGDLVNGVFVASPKRLVKKLTPKKPRDFHFDIDYWVQVVNDAFPPR